MKQLFLKSNLLHIRTNEGEFEVSPECYTKGTSRDGENYWYNVDTGTTTVGIGEKEKFEWLGGVELIETCKWRGNRDACANEVCWDLEQCQGNPTVKLARLIPEEKKEFDPHLPCVPDKKPIDLEKLARKVKAEHIKKHNRNFMTPEEAISGSHSFTESAYKEFETGEVCPQCGCLAHPVNKGPFNRWHCYNRQCPNCDPVESSEPQERPCGGINCPFQYSCVDGCMYPIKKPVSAPSESQEELNVVLSDLTAFQNTLHESGFVTFRNLRGDIISVKGMIQHITKLLTRNP